MKPIFYRTGEIAKMLGFAPRTIAKWVDSGLLPGFKIPGSTHRRVVHEDLVKFVFKYGIPLHPKLEKKD